MDLHKTIRKRKEEQKKMNENTQSVQVVPFNERYDVRILGSGGYGQ